MAPQNNPKEIPTVAAGDQVDRLTALPDVIIHDILARLRSPRQAGSFMALSKRWTHLWRSYPNLEFNFHHDTEESLDTFAAAVTKKYSILPAAESLRITGGDVSSSCPDNFMDSMLQLGARISPREIDIQIKKYDFPPEFFSGGGFRRLEVLKLAHCNFYGYYAGEIKNPFASLGNSLKVLCLHHVTFSRGDDRTLTSLVSGASLLETLKLSHLTVPRPHWYSSEELPRFRIRNHQTLKTLKMESVCIKDFEISGAPSLETLHLDDFKYGDFEASSTPNLKVLRFKSNFKSDRNYRLYYYRMTNDKINNLISMFPSLESLTLKNLRELSHLNIVTCHELRELKLTSWDKLRSIEIDAASLIKFRYTVYGCHHLPTVLVRACSCNAVDVVKLKKVLPYINSETLKKLLDKLARFRLTLNLSCHYDQLLLSRRASDHVPIIEHAKFPLHFDQFRKIDVFLNILFLTCRPKCLSFIGETDQVSNDDFVSTFEYVSEQLMDRGCGNVCKAGCECWRHRLTDVKAFKRVKEGSIMKDETLDVSWDALRSLGEKEHILFILTWN
ncbi:Putative FBD-associated F-box protein At3g50710 [Linum grandiflorum]